MGALVTGTMVLGLRRPFPEGMLLSVQPGQGRGGRHVTRVDTVTNRCLTVETL